MSPLCRALLSTVQRLQLQSNSLAGINSPMKKHKNRSSCMKHKESCRGNFIKYSTNIMVELMGLVIL